MRPHGKVGAVHFLRVDHEVEHLPDGRLEVKGARLEKAVDHGAKVGALVWARGERGRGKRPGGRGGCPRISRGEEVLVGVRQVGSFHGVVDLRSRSVFSTERRGWWWLEPIL